MKMIVYKQSHMLFEASCGGLACFLSLEKLIWMSEKD